MRFNAFELLSTNSAGTAKLQVAIPLLALILIGCSGKGDTPSPSAPVVHKTAPADPWLLTCLDPSIENPALLWNGEIGIRLGRDARAAGPMFMIDEYDATGEEKIKPLQNPVSALLYQGSNELATVEADTWKSITDYSQVLDMHTGLLTTTWTERIPTQTNPNRTATITCETVLHPSKRIVAQRWTARTANGPADMFAEAEVAGRQLLTPKRDKVQTDETVAYQGLEGANLPWALRRRDLAKMSGAIESGQPLACELIWSFGRSPSSLSLIGPNGVTAKPIKGWDQPEPPPAFDWVLADAQKAWAKRWQTDIEIDGPVEDQQAVRSFLFYLRSAIARDGNMSISPFGLSNALYNGHVFWDADMWVFPALALIDPEEAKSIPAYRLNRTAVATRNFLEWLNQGRPVAGGNMGRLSVKGKIQPGYKFPWESSVSGNETIPGDSRFEEHINGDVAWTLTQAASLGLIPEIEAKKATEAIARYWRWRSVHFMGTDNINGVMSPDEHHIGDNDLYTNLLAQWCLNGGNWDRRHPAGEAGGRPALRLPRDKTTFLTYDNDLLKGYKQAAAILSIYPLQYPPAEREAKAMMDRFADKVVKDGPAMTTSLDALIWARMGQTDKAYETWQKSWKEFVKEPHLQFSEKRHKPITYFITGAAGCLQTVIYGFLGLRIDEPTGSRSKLATQSIPLGLGRTLSMSPSLPNAWKSVRLKNFTVRGKRYTFTASKDGEVGITPGDK